MDHQIKHALTDLEIQKIAERVAVELEENLYNNVGKGVMSLVYKGILILLVVLAAYGAGMSWFKVH